MKGHTDVRPISQEDSTTLQPRKSMEEIVTFVMDHFEAIPEGSTRIYKDGEYIRITHISDDENFQGWHRIKEGEEGKYEDYR